MQGKHMEITWKSEQDLNQVLFYYAFLEERKAHGNNYLSLYIRRSYSCGVFDSAREDKISYGV